MVMIVVQFVGMEMTELIRANELARIRVEADGTPGSNDMPGALTFWTTPDGSIATAERMRIAIASGSLIVVCALAAAVLPMAAHTSGFIHESGNRKTLYAVSQLLIQFAYNSGDDNRFIAWYVPELHRQLLTGM